MPTNHKIILLSTVLLIIAACKPELVDEDGPLKVHDFRLAPLPDTIVEDDYTQPPCLALLDSNHISLNINTDEIDRVEVTEEEGEEVLIKVISEYSSPQMTMDIYLNPDSLPMVRKNYELVKQTKPGVDECYIFIRLGGHGGTRFRSTGGTAHYYRKENGGFKIHLCDATFEENDGSPPEYNGGGWIEK